MMIMRRFAVLSSLLAAVVVAADSGGHVVLDHGIKPSNMELASCVAGQGPKTITRSVWVDAQDDAANGCFYCQNVGGGLGSVKCNDVAKVPVPGSQAWANNGTATCNPELRYAGPNCTGTVQNTGTDCQTSKRLFVDP